MEGIERIKERILEEAREEAEVEIQRAETRADEIISRAETEAEDIKEELLEKAVQEAEAARDRLISMAELDLKKELLATKQELVEEAFQKALENLKNMDAGDYQEILSKMILRAVETGDEAIILSKSDQDKLSDDFLDKLNQSQEKEMNLNLVKEDRNFEGGFILKTEGVEQNNSFESIIRMERDNLESKIASILFQD